MQIPNDARIRAIFAEVGRVVAGRMLAETRLEALEIDSVTMVEVIFALEEAFDIALPLDLSLAEMDLSGLVQMVGDLVKVRP